MNDICSVDILENRKNFLIHYSQRQTLRPAQRKCDFNYNIYFFQESMDVRNLNYMYYSVI